MGALADTLAQKKTFSAGSPLGRWLQAEINRLSVDEAVPAAATATDAVWDIAQSTQTSGNMTLTISVRRLDGVVETFTTGNIPYNGGQVDVENAINSGASGSITGWTNGDIDAQGSAINSVTNIELHFSGASVTGRVVTDVTLNDVSGAGGAWGAVTQTTEGQSDRPALGVLLNYGVLSAADAQDAAASFQSGFTKGSGSESQRLHGGIIKALMREAAAEDANNSTSFSIESVLYPQDRAPSPEPRTTGDGDVRVRDV